MIIDMRLSLSNIVCCKPYENMDMIEPSVLCGFRGVGLRAMSAAHELTDPQPNTDASGYLVIINSRLRRKHKSKAFFSQNTAPL